jgi:hypothetical protein
MFWKRGDKGQKGSKLQGPADIPDTVKKYLASNPLFDAGIVPFLKATVKSSDKGERVSDIIIYDPADAEARDIKVLNYDTFKPNPELIMAEGSFDEATKKVELTARHAVSKIQFLTYQEILQQVQGLKEPGSSVFFFVNAGTGTGGPLGRGAAVIRVNPPGESKKTKKYAVFGANVVDMHPTTKENLIFDSDKPDQIAKWVSDSHKPRFC